MKIAIIGAGGVRTPLLVHAMVLRKAELGIDELALMDIDGAHLELIGRVTQQLEHQQGGHIHLTRTTDLKKALHGADFVITTFRVGGAESRVVDERVPLAYGVLGQETTGPGGFAMAMRTLPVLRTILSVMEMECPQAWLINFANPSGLLTEAILNRFGWHRAVGICDAPTVIRRVAAGLLGVPDESVFLDYFGLNHLGWARAVLLNGQDQLPALLSRLGKDVHIAELPTSVEMIRHLGMIPNEYLYYYYQKHAAVEHILGAMETRGEQVVRINRQLFTDLQDLARDEDEQALLARYAQYLQERESSYMSAETGQSHSAVQISAERLGSIANSGYAGVALDVIEALSGKQSRTMIINTHNRGAISGMQEDDVVEIPAGLSGGIVRPYATGELPAHCLGLMLQVKEYERLSISAALDGSYEKAIVALTLHPLFSDERLAKKILDGYIERHAGLFPTLK